MIDSKDNIKKLYDDKGIRVFYIETTKFKTNQINIFLYDDLKKESATKNALVSMLLKRGTNKYKTYKEITEKLESLYGSVFEVGVSKKGERQILQFYAECIRNSYIQMKESLFEQVSQIVFEVFKNPLIENDGFNEEYVRQEKQNLKDIIDAQLNDKVSYASRRCIEVMCENEPFSINEFGIYEDIDTINNKELWSHYSNLLKHANFDIYVSGTDVLNEVEKVVEIIKGFERGEINKLSSIGTMKDAGELKSVTEHFPVNQAKLSLGFRTDVKYDSDDYIPMVMCNGILGGGIHSKLFNNVREKESLCYYAYAKYERYKSILLISSGIEEQNKEKAQNLIIKQIEDIKNGDISDYEFESTFSTFKTSIESMRDSQFQMVDYYVTVDIVGKEPDLDGFLEKLKNVSKEDIMRVAKTIKLETVYFLTGNK